MELDPRARDLVVRTVLGEAANEPDDGMTAVAAVIRNRTQSGRYGGDNPVKVITAPNQFEPWNTQAGRDRMFSYSPDSPAYKRASAAVDLAFNGEDPTGGATHFYSPSAQAALGRNAPKWAQGEGQEIGRHTFFAPEGRVTDMSSQQRQPQPVSDESVLARFQQSQTKPVADPEVLSRFQASQQPQQQEAGPQSPENVRLAREGASPLAPQEPQQSILQKVSEPITSYPHTYNEMRKEGAQQLTTGVDQMRNAASGEDAMGYPVNRAWEATRGVGNSVAGGLGYLTSPVNAALRTVVGKPIEENTGIPKEYTEFAASLALPVMGMTKVSALPAPARILKPGEQVVQAGENLKGVGSGGAVEIPKAVATDSMAVQRAAALARNAPGAGEPIIQATERTIGQLGQKAEDVASGYGGGTVVGSGEAAKTGIREWITGKSKEIATKLYDKVDALIDNTKNTTLDNTINAAADILARRQNAAISQPSEAVKRIKDAITRPGGMNYEGIKDLRSYIGEMIDGSKLLPADISAKELKAIYGGLSDDLANSVKNSGGPQAEAAFNKANNYYKLASERRETLAKIIGKDGDAAPEKVFDQLASMASSTSRADVTKLAQARKAIGADGWNEFASGVVGRLGRDASGNFSPERFLTAYGKLSESGKSILFRSTDKAHLAPYLDDIATVSSRFKELNKFSNPSGTGQQAIGAATLGGFMAAPLTTIGTVLGANVLSRVLASAATVAPAAQWTRKYSIAVQSPTPANVAQLTIASRNFANTVNSQFGTEISAQDFLRAIQGGVPARADNE
jgi:hypothetical protein